MLRTVRIRPVEVVGLGGDRLHVLQVVAVEERRNDVADRADLQHVVDVNVGDLLADRIGFFRTELDLDEAFRQIPELLDVFRRLDAFRAVGLLPGGPVEAGSRIEEIAERRHEHGHVLADGRAGIAVIFPDREVEIVVVAGGAVFVGSDFLQIDADADGRPIIADQFLKLHRRALAGIDQTHDQRFAVGTFQRAVAVGILQAHFSKQCLGLVGIVGDCRGPDARR